MSTNHGLYIHVVFFFKTNLIRFFEVKLFFRKSIYFNRSFSTFPMFSLINTLGNPNAVQVQKRDRGWWFVFLFFLVCVQWIFWSELLCNFFLCIRVELNLTSSTYRYNCKCNKIIYLPIEIKVNSKLLQTIE